MFQAEERESVQRRRVFENPKKGSTAEVQEMEGACRARSLARLSGRLAFVPRAVGTRDSNMTRFTSRKDLWDGSVENELILSEM